MDNKQLMRQLLDRGWTEADLRLADAWLGRLEADPSALDELRTYDRLRQVMGPTDQDAVASDPGPKEGWACFERRLNSAVADAGRPGVLRGPFALGRGGWGVGLLAACLVLMGGVGGWWLSTAARTPTAMVADASAGESAPVERAARHAVPSTAEVAEQVRAFTEVSRVLDHQAAWLSLSERSSDVGLSAEPVSPNQRLLLLRLSVHRGDQLVSRSDLIIVPGHSAELTVPVTGRDGKGGKELRYVINVSDDVPAMLSLWVELAAPGEPSQTLAALATQLRPEPGRVRSAGELVAGSDEYRVKVGFSEPGPRPENPRRGDQL